MRILCGTIMAAMAVAVQGGADCNSAGTDSIKAFILKGFGIVWEQAPLSIDISPLPDSVEKLPGVGFIE
jgi:hypothetical protein